MIEDSSASNMSQRRKGASLSGSGVRKAPVLDPSVAPTPTLPTAHISHILPDTGSMLGGTQITLLGSHFPRSSRCFFGSEEATTMWLGEGSLLCTSPPARKPGPVPLTIRLDGQTSGIDDLAQFRYQDDLYKELTGIVSLIVQDADETDQNAAEAPRLPPPDMIPSTLSPPLPNADAPLSMHSGDQSAQTMALPIGKPPMVDYQRVVTDFVGLCCAEDSVSATRKLTLASESRRTLLHLGAALGFHKLLRKLKTYTTVLDGRDVGGRTAVHYAALYGHLECAKLLIDGGADIQVRDEHGRLPQDLVHSDHHDMKNILDIRQSSSVNVRIVDDQGRQARALSVSRALRPDVDEPATVVSPRDYVSRALPGTSSPPSDVTNGKAKLLISVDVGTSQSAVAVSYCKPGARPIVIHIARWPGQECALYEEKVPSVLIYDCDGQLVACGAEGASRAKELEAEDTSWSYVKNFKMHLHPATILQKNDLPLKEIPPNVDLLKVYSDFLRYLFGHTQTCLRESTDSDPWLELRGQAEVILTHPNGWNVIQQRFLQKAVVATGLVPAGEIQTRLHFIEEGEAAASFCMSMHATLAGSITTGTQFIVCDGGGSTADISAYRVKANILNAISLDEIGLPSCIDGGGVRVDASFTTYLRRELTAIPDFADTEDIPDILSDACRDFESRCKRTFTSPSESCTVRIGGRKMNSKRLGVAKGILTLDGTTVEQFFKPSVDAIINDIQHKMRNQAIDFIILTGGFGQSPYLKYALETRLNPKTRVIVANSPNSKAVAIGALRLLTEGPGRITIRRTKRPWKTWIANIAKVKRPFRDHV